MQGQKGQEGAFLMNTLRVVAKGKSRLLRYIHLNPVEAKLVSHPEKYRWSSHNAYLNRADFTWLHRDRIGPTSDR